MSVKTVSSSNLNYNNRNAAIITDEENSEKTFEHKNCMWNSCGMNFNNKFILRANENCHILKNCNIQDKKADEMRTKQNICNVCCKKFTAKKNLLKHLRDVHKKFEEADQMVVKKSKCPKENCNFAFRMVKEVREHIEKFHKTKLLKDTLEFPNKEEFQKWKKEEESNTISLFVTNRKKTTLSDGTKRQTLYCHRTGYYNPKGFGKYRMKSVGSCKTGKTCPASMELTEHLDGQISVTYYKTHLGHRQDVAFIKLSKEERQNLAEKIEQGFTFEAILEDVKESNESTKEVKKRIQLLSKKDLYSIKKSFDSDCIKKLKKENNKKCSNEVANAQLLQNHLVLKEKQEIGKTESRPKLNINSLENVFFPQNISSFGVAPTTGSNTKKETTPSPMEEGVPPQIVILSPEVNCTSVAEIILLSSTNPNILRPNVSVDLNLQYNNNNSRSVELSQEEKNRVNRSNLRLQLKDKVDKVVEFLPNSELLTPKQFSLVKAKLDGIINIFNEASLKAKRKKHNLNKKKVRKGREDEEILSQKPQNKVKSTQNIYETPVLYSMSN